MEKPNISVNSKKSSFIGSENCIRLLNKKSTQVSPRIKRTKSINCNASATFNHNSEHSSNPTTLTAKKVYFSPDALKSKEQVVTIAFKLPKEQQLRMNSQAHSLKIIINFEEDDSIKQHSNTTSKHLKEESSNSLHNTEKKIKRKSTNMNIDDSDFTSSTSINVKWKPGMIKRSRTLYTQPVKVTEEKKLDRKLISNLNEELKKKNSGMKSSNRQRTQHTTSKAYSQDLLKIISAKNPNSKHKKSKTQVVYTEYDGINNIGESFSSELHNNNNNNNNNNQNNITQQRTHSEDISDELIRQKSMNSIEVLSMNVNKEEMKNSDDDVYTAQEQEQDQEQGVKLKNGTVVPSINIPNKDVNDSNSNSNTTTIQRRQNKRYSSKRSEDAENKFILIRRKQIEEHKNENEMFNDNEYEIKTKNDISIIKLLSQKEDNIIQPKSDRSNNCNIKINRVVTLNNDNQIKCKSSRGMNIDKCIMKEFQQLFMGNQAQEGKSGVSKGKERCDKELDFEDEEGDITITNKDINISNIDNSLMGSNCNMHSNKNSLNNNQLGKLVNYKEEDVVEYEDKNGNVVQVVRKEGVEGKKEVEFVDCNGNVVDVSKLKQKRVVRRGNNSNNDIKDNIKVQNECNSNSNNNNEHKGQNINLEDDINNMNIGNDKKVSLFGNRNSTSCNKETEINTVNDKNYMNNKENTIDVNDNNNNISINKDNAIYVNNHINCTQDNNNVNYVNDHNEHSSLPNPEHHQDKQIEYHSPIKQQQTITTNNNIDNIILTGNNNNNNFINDTNNNTNKTQLELMNMLITKPNSQNTLSPNINISNNTDINEITPTSLDIIYKIGLSNTPNQPQLPSTTINNKEHDINSKLEQEPPILNQSPSLEYNTNIPEEQTQNEDSFYNESTKFKLQPFIPNTTSKGVTIKNFSEILKQNKLNKHELQSNVNSFQQDFTSQHTTNPISRNNQNSNIHITNPYSLTQLNNDKLTSHIHYSHFNTPSKNMKNKPKNSQSLYLSKCSPNTNDNNSNSNSNKNVTKLMNNKFKCLNNLITINEFTKKNKPLNEDDNHHIQGGDIKKEIFYLRQKDIQSIKPANAIIFTSNDNEDEEDQ